MEKIKTFLFTDSKLLFDAMNNKKRTTERRLLIVSFSARRAYCCFEIYGVALFCGEDDPFESLNGVIGNQ